MELEDTEHEYFDLRDFKKELAGVLKEEGGPGHRTIECISEAVALSHLKAFIRRELDEEGLKEEEPLQVLATGLRMVTYFAIRCLSQKEILRPILKAGLVKLGMLYVSRFGFLKATYHDCGLFFIWGILFNVWELMPDDILKKDGERWYDLLLKKFRFLGRQASGGNAISAECEELYLAKKSPLKRKRGDKFNKLIDSLFQGEDCPRIVAAHPDELMSKVENFARAFPKEVDQQVFKEGGGIVPPVDPYSVRTRRVMESMATKSSGCLPMDPQVQLEDIKKESELHLAQGYTFTVKEMVGKGTFGHVFRATRSGKGSVMIKCQKTSHALSEFYILTQLKLRHSRNDAPFQEIAALFRNGVSSVLVGRFYHEDTLFEYFKKTDPLSEKMIGNIVHQLLDAVMFLHQLGIAHNDIKSDNILVSATLPLKIRLIDFGRAIDLRLFPPQAEFIPQKRHYKKNDLRSSLHQQDLGLPWRLHEDYFHSASIIYFLIAKSCLDTPRSQPTLPISTFEAKVCPKFTKHPIWDDIIHLLINPDLVAAKALKVDLSPTPAHSCPYRSRFDASVQTKLTSLMGRLLRLT